MEEEKKTRRKRKPTKEQSAYISRVKNILRLALGEYGLGFPQLRKELEETYGVHINLGTLKALFEPADMSLDSICLLTVCKYFGLDMNELLQPEAKPEHPERFRDIAEKVKAADYTGDGATLGLVHDPFWESIASTREKFPVLENDGYTGDFYGYLMSSNEMREYRTFILSLKKDENGVMHAVMEKHTGGEPQIYRGVPLFAKSHGAVLMFLTNEEHSGEFYFLAMGFERYPDKGLLFRKGLAVTGGGYASKSIYSQNFVLCKNKLSEDKIRYLDGLLKAPDNQFCISVEDADRLAEEYPEVKNFMEKASDALGRRTENMYALSENDIYSLRLPGLSKYDRMKAMLILKGSSFMADTYCYRARGTYSNFAVDCLLDELPEKNDFGDDPEPKR